MESKMVGDIKYKEIRDVSKEVSSGGQGFGHM